MSVVKGLTSDLIRPKIWNQKNKSPCAAAAEGARSHVADSPHDDRRARSAPPPPRRSAWPAPRAHSAAAPAAPPPGGAPPARCRGPASAGPGPPAAAERACSAPIEARWRVQCAARSPAWTSGRLHPQTSTTKMEAEPCSYASNSTTEHLEPGESMAPV